MLLKLNISLTRPIIGQQTKDAVYSLSTRSERSRVRSVRHAIVLIYGQTKVWLGICFQGVCSEDESRSTRDSRLHIKDGDSAGAIRDEIAMEKVAGYENMSAGEYHFIKTAYRYQAD